MTRYFGITWLGPLDPTDPRAVEVLYDLEVEQAGREVPASSVGPETWDMMQNATTSVFDQYVPPPAVGDDEARRRVEVLLDRCYPSDRDIVGRRLAGVEQHQIGRRHGVVQQAVSAALRRTRARLRVAEQLDPIPLAELEATMLEHGTPPGAARCAAPFYLLPNAAQLSQLLGVARQMVSRSALRAAEDLPDGHPFGVLVRDWPMRKAGHMPGETIADHVRGGRQGWEALRQHLDLQVGDALFVPVANRTGRKVRYNRVIRRD